MDGHRFDHLARAFATVNRRRLLQLLAGGIAGGLGGVLTGRVPRLDAQAQTCKTDADCSGGLKCCAGVCTDIQTDAKHCGFCDSPCPASNPTCCAGNCRNLKESPDNCGACGNACPAGEFCTSGECCIQAGVCGNLCCKAGESCLGVFSGGAVCCPARQVCGEACCNPRDVCVTGDPVDTCCPEFRFCVGTCCPEGQICIDGQCARDPALDATPTSGQTDDGEVSDDGTTEEVSQAEYQTCDAACRKPKRKDQIRPYLVSCLTNKPCTDTGCGCHLYRKAKAEDATWEHYADQGVEKGLDDDAYTYECRCVRAKSSQTSIAECEEVASESVLQRQLAALADAGLRPGDLGASSARVLGNAARALTLQDDGDQEYVLIESTLAVDPARVAGLSDEQQTALTNLGWVGAYTSVLGKPAADAASYTTTYRLTAHVFPCPPAGVSPDELYGMVNLLPVGAKDDERAKPLEGADFSEGYAATKDGSLYVGLGGVRDNVLFGFGLETTEEMTQGQARGLLKRVAEASLSRMPRSTDAFGSETNPSNFLVIPEWAKRAKTISVAVRYDQGEFIPRAGEAAEIATFLTQLYANTNVVKAIEMSAERRSVPFLLTIRRHGDAESALAAYATSREQVDAVPLVGGAAQTVDRPLPEGSSAKRTISVIHLPTLQGGIISATVTDDYSRESSMFGADIPPGADVEQVIRGAVGDGPFEDFLTHSHLQVECLTKENESELCLLFGGLAEAVPESPEEEPEQEAETVQLPNVLSVYAGAEFAARVPVGWRQGVAKKCIGADGCLAAGLPSTEQQSFSAAILKGYEVSTLRRGADDQPAETTRDHYFLFGSQASFDPFFTYAQTLVPADAEDETPRLGRSDLLFAWRYPVTLDGGVPATTKLIGARAGDLAMLFSQTFIAGTPSLAAVEDRAGRTLDLLTNQDVAAASRLTWAMPYLVGSGIETGFDVHLTAFNGQRLPRDGATDEERRLEEDSLDDIVHAAQLRQTIARFGPLSFEGGVRAWQMKDAAAAESYVSRAPQSFYDIFRGFTVREEPTFTELGDQSSGYLAWGPTASGQFWAGATGFVRRDNWVGSFGVSILTDQATPDLEAAVQEGSFLISPALAGLQYQLRLWDGEETDRGFQLEIKYPVDDSPEAPPAILGDGKIVPWLSLGSLAQVDDFPLEVRLQHAIRCVRPGALPGLTRSEAQASRDLGAREGIDLKYDDFDGPPIAMTGFARFEDQQGAWNAFDWYRKVEYPGLVPREAAAPFAGYAYDFSFIPNLKLGTLEAADWTRLTFPYGNLGVAVFGRGDVAEQVQEYGKLVLERLEQGEPRGGGLDRTMVQLAGSNVDPYLVFSPLVLNGRWVAQPGEDAAAVQARAGENPDHEDWFRSQQQLRSRVDGVDHALVDEKRRFASQAAAQAWFLDIEARLARTFVGINLITITEAAGLAKPDGLADAVKAFLIDYRPSPTQVNAGLLIYALRGSVVAALNLRGVSESAEDQAVIDFFAWLFREGGLPLALFGVEIMAKELALLDYYFPDDEGDDDDDDDEDFSPRLTVDPLHVYRAEGARRSP